MSTGLQKKFDFFFANSAGQILKAASQPIFSQLSQLAILQFSSIVIEENKLNLIRTELLRDLSNLINSSFDKMKR